MICAAKTGDAGNVLGNVSKMRGAWLRTIGVGLAVLVTAGAGGFGSARAQGLHALTAGNGVAPPTIVIGFVGGLVRHDDKVHTEVQLAEKLREAYPLGVYVEAFENRRREDARKTILTLLDTDHCGKPSEEEKSKARVILYGHSWGASAAVELARELQQDGVPVLLTAQVDSISKMGINDGLIPGNVGRAINFYQPDGLLHGRPEIRAADPAHTKILGNFRYSYTELPTECKDYPWHTKVFTKTHTAIECDPRVWSQVESLIREELGPATAAHGSVAGSK
jgi:pimeloyl-ACP methyl ester carboxylesterase